MPQVRACLFLWLTPPRRRVPTRQPCFSHPAVHPSYSSVGLDEIRSRTLTWVKRVHIHYILDSIVVNWRTRSFEVIVLMFVCWKDSYVENTAYSSWFTNMVRNTANTNLKSSQCEKARRIIFSKVAPWESVYRILMNWVEIFSPNSGFHQTLFFRLSEPKRR